MMGRNRIPAVLLLALAPAFSQTPAPAARNQVPGVVASVDTPAGTITIKSDQGETVRVSTSAQTVIIRLPAGETDIKKGVRIAASALQPGDRVVAFVKPATGGQPAQATSLVVRTKADMAATRAREIEDWNKRGTSGIVTHVDAATGTITMQAGPRSITVRTGEHTGFERYSPESAKPADARPGNLSEIAAGNQINVLGDRAPDGAINAEQIYSGAFRQIAATVTSVDAAAGQLLVTDLATRKPLNIHITTDTSIRKIPPERAQALARRYRSGGRDGQGETPSIARLPAIALGELKPKDAIMVSTTQGTDGEHVTAIVLLAGVEPLLTASPNAARDIMSGWNLSGGEEQDQ
jgi:hypothetical protein